MNLKALEKSLEFHDLMDKPLREFSREEILKLSASFSIAYTASKGCNECWFIGWVGLKTWCLHSDHPGIIHPHSLGNRCPDWSDFLDKEIGPHKLNRKPKLDPEAIQQ